MKKILFFIAMVAMIASVASAQATVSVGGAVKAGIGMDLDTVDTGIDVSIQGVHVSVTPALDTDSVTAGKADDGDTMYGEISLGGIGIAIDSGAGSNGEAADLSGSYQNFQPSEQNVTKVWRLNWGGFSAKLVLGNLEVLLVNGTDINMNYQGNGRYAWYLKNAYDYPIYDGTYGGNDSQTLGQGNDLGSFPWDNPYFDVLAYGEGWPNAYGTDQDNVIGVKLTIPEIIVVQVDAASHDSWASTTYENEYAFKGSIDLKAVENLTFSAGASINNYAGDGFLTAGAKLGYKIAIGESDSIEPIAALTYMQDGSGLFSVSGGISASIAGIKATAYGAYATDIAATDDRIGFTVAADIGAVENLILQAAYEFYSQTIAGAPAAGVYGISGKVGYGIAAGDITITPSVSASYDDQNTLAASVNDEALYAKVEVTVAGLLDNTTFALNWDSNDLLDHETAVAGNILGQLVLSTKVSF